MDDHDPPADLLHLRKDVGGEDNHVLAAQVADQLGT
jgi:hypothetical protein